MNQGKNAIVKIVAMTALFLTIIAFFRGISPNHPGDVPAPPPIINPIPDPQPPLPVKEPGDSFPWVAYATKKNTTDKRWGPVLTDIEQHLDPKHGRQYYSPDNITHGHETTHGVNSDIRNNLGGMGKNGLYCLEGRAAVLTDPRCRITQVAPVIPHSLRGMRYNLYMVQQARQWDDQPTYIFDEWVAYINGTLTGIDQVKHGLMNNRVAGEDIQVSFFNNYSSDDAIAPMEFTYYALALCLTVKQHDPGYFQAHPEFSEFVAFNVRRSVLAFREAIKMPAFQWDTKLIDTFISSEDARPLRDMAVELWGKPFCDKYLFTK